MTEVLNQRYKGLSLQEQWEVSAGTDEHLAYIAFAEAQIEGSIHGYSDNRHGLAYASLLSGGRYGSVHAIGEPGTGKTEFGDIIFGSKNRTEINANDTEASLYGHPSPVHGAQVMVPGKMPFNDDKRVAYLNEIGNLQVDPGALLPLWDASQKFINGQMRDLSGLAIYSTANYPNGRRVGKMDSALVSRIGLSVLFGDIPSDQSTSLIMGLIKDRRASINSRLMNSGLEPISAIEEDKNDNIPLLPGVDVRNKIAGLKEEMFSVGDSEEVASYIAGLTKEINSSGLFSSELPVSDARLALALIDCAQSWLLLRSARQLTTERKLPSSVSLSPIHIAQIASLVIAHRVNGLHPDITETIADNNHLDGLTNTQESKIARRGIATIAIGTYWRNRKVPTESEQNLQEYLARNIKARDQLIQGSSYVNVDASGINVDKELQGVLGS